MNDIQPRRPNPTVETGGDAINSLLIILSWVVLFVCGVMVGRA